MSSNIEVKKICQWCGKEFIARTTVTAFCCHRCSGLAYKERKRQEKLKKAQQEFQHVQSGKSEVESQEFFTPRQAAILMGLCPKTIYNYINSGSIKVWQLGKKTLIRRTDIDALFSEGKPRERKIGIQSTITEFYTSKEVQEKYGISNGGMYKMAKAENWPHTTQRGKTLWSKKHVDAHFAKKAPDPEITEWYTLAEIKEKFCMTDSAIWNFTSKEAIPKKKDGKITLYSKKHVDIAKGIAEPEEESYYTMVEAMEKFNLTRDQLHHYLKTRGVTRVKVGKFVKISKRELDKIFEPPTI